MTQATLYKRPAPPRPRFSGVWQTVRFNYPLFLAAALAVCVGTAILSFAPLASWVRWMLFVIVLLGASWALMTILVAHLVYDRSDAFGFRWLSSYLQSAQTWANVHAGFDQTSNMLREVLPNSAGIPVDIYDPAVTTESSIRRARAATQAPSGTRTGRYDQLPLADQSLDMVLFLFAAHELRTSAQREALFNEATRALKPGGVIVLAEHMRGFMTALAFGPGVFHFHSEKQWLRAGASSQLTLDQRIHLTPFAGALIWRKSQ